LGHIILGEGIVVDLEKIEAIRGWSMPKNVTEVRSFMGLSCYYMRFIEVFSKIAHPSISMQKKGVKFQWTLDCEKSFQHLKNLLTSVPILRIVDPNEEFSQNGYVVCYESRNLKEHERNYATHDLELVAIVDALNMWRHYHMGKRLRLKTDHSGLKYLFG
jgi:hypothetical protein